MWYRNQKTEQTGSSLSACDDYTNQKCPISQLKF